MEAVVLAGGFGTRLASVVKDVPKPMAPVADKPFLVYVVDDLIAQGVDHIVMAVCYKKECIIGFFGDCYKGVQIDYSVEEKPLFTGGAIKQALSMCHDDMVMIINGDTFFSVDLKEMRRFSERTHAKVVIAVKEMENFDRYGKIEFDKEQRVTLFAEKAPCKKGWINGGIYDIRKDCLAEYPEKFSFEQKALPKLLLEKEISVFQSSGLFIDIGIPDEYDRAQSLFEGQ